MTIHDISRYQEQHAVACDTPTWTKERPQHTCDPKHGFYRANCSNDNHRYYARHGENWRED